MDYVDPEKIKQHRILLLVGYVFVGVAILIASLVLLYQTNGFGINRNGEVIQNGLVFFSTKPTGSQIYLDGKLNENKTNARLFLPTNIYDVELRREGYHSWKRKVAVNGGGVQHFDYPVLFPKTLQTDVLDTLETTPGFASQSLDRRWLVVPVPQDINAFTVYDLKSNVKDAVTISLPPNLITKAEGAESWQVAEWADDNTHLLLVHAYDDKYEYILLDRENPAQSININKVLVVTPTKITLNDKKFDKYYLYNAANQTLQTASLADVVPVPITDSVLAYQSFSDDTVLYATSVGAPVGKATIKLKIADQTYTIRTVTASNNYLVNLARYDNALYVVAGSNADERVYIYRDPVRQIKTRPSGVAVPIQVLRLPQSTKLSFSANAQFVMAENGNQIAVYDFENRNGYNYKMTAGLDPPQAHVEWMDPFHFQYVSGGQLVVMDYDQENPHTLVPALPQFKPSFSPNYNYVYSFIKAPGSDTRVNLTQTSLLSPKDK